MTTEANPKPDDSSAVDPGNLSPPAAEPTGSPGAAPRTAPRLRRALHSVEAASAVMQANSPTPGAALTLARVMPAWLPWRSHPIGAIVAACARYPDRTAIVDDEGTFSFRALAASTNSLARAWKEAGLGPGTTIGVLAAPGRLFIQASVAGQKLGADVVYLNAAFSAPQVAGVVADEGIDVLVHDETLAAAAQEANPSHVFGPEAVRALTEQTSSKSVRPPGEPGRVVVLTSGTTGRPKGASRGGRARPLDAAGLLACLPVMTGDRFVVAAPLFHGLGMLGATLGLALSSTVAVRSRFDPEQTLADIASTRAAVLVAVPVMLQRILQLPHRTLESYDVSSLRVVLCGGSALPIDLAERFMDRFGDVLYNFYGSTEAGWATCAAPRDLRSAPGTVGRATPGVTVRVADDQGRRMSANEPGRVLVGSDLRMDGYTGGGGKEIIDGLVATGDVGHMDRAGRLFIDGRDDEMIVSGGENVFPAEVEEVLAAHPGIREAAVIGVDDEQFGQRLKAFVVSGSTTLDEDGVKAYIHDRLARFKTPREVEFLDSLPRNAVGKVLKRELRGRDD